jgi:hypothetical protein
MRQLVPPDLGTGISMEHGRRSLPFIGTHRGRHWWEVGPAPVIPADLRHATFKFHVNLAQTMTAMKLPGGETKPNQNQREKKSQPELKAPPQGLGQEVPAHASMQ